MKKILAIVLMTALLVCPVFASAEAAGASAEPAAADLYAAVEVTKAATCTENGLLTYTLSDGTVIQIETPATGAHDYVVTETPATCTEDGAVVSVCSVCGDTVTEAIPAAGHNYEYQYDAQQAEDGSFVTYGTWACTVCGNVVDATEGNAAYYYGESETAAPAASDEAGASAEASEEASDEAAAPADPQNGKWAGIELVVALVLVLELAVIMFSFKKKSK